jgi:predicted CoA-binding protein
MRVAVLGASPNPARYSNKAIKMLRSHGHDVVPVNPAHAEIEGLAAVPKLADVKGAVDTVTVYVGPDHIGPLIPEIVALEPRRVIMNPGAESRALSDALAQKGIEAVEACTLVLLSTGQF